MVLRTQARILFLKTREAIASASSLLVDVTGINMDGDETTIGRIASDDYNSYNVSEGILHFQND